MQIVILFGGGDAGGIIIDENGVHPIPPFDPGYRIALGALAKLAQVASHAQFSGVAREIHGFLPALTSAVVAGIGKQVGGGENIALVSMEDDGVFTCGTKVPGRFWPRPVTFSGRWRAICS